MLENFEMENPLVCIDTIVKNQISVIQSCRQSIDALITAEEYILAKNLYEEIRQTILKKTYTSHASYSASYIDQLERAALSIVLNIAEGIGKTRGYMTNHYLIARGSAFEVYACLEVCRLETANCKILISAIEKKILEDCE